MMPFKSLEGISEGEIYKERISNASSENDRFFHFDSQSLGAEGISSGMNRPPSEASPFSTASSKENYMVLASMALIQCKWAGNTP
jgi:hypothetical protein